MSDRALVENRDVAPGGNEENVRGSPLMEEVFFYIKYSYALVVRRFSI